MSDDLYKERLIEQKRVNFVASEIDKKAYKLQHNAGKISTDVLEIRKTFWNDVTVNFDEADDVAETAASIKQQAELLSERERTHYQIDRQLRTLARLKNSPYFGRIDFIEKDEKTAEQIYLGIASFMDEHDENFLIYDWRAPISSLYYDYAPGPAQYDTPAGKIEGEMTLKRQFIIRDSKINGMFDTGITIVDEMLQEVLGHNASTQMKSIVATIQREQNRIIRNERSQLLIVQGVAGSGKTSAALQRVAYLLYRHRETLNAENILLFSPNPLFNSYVATVLPELGEENMQQSTFQEYINGRISKEFYVEDPFVQMEYLLSDKSDQDYQTRINGIRFKSSLKFKELIDQYALKLSNRGLIFKDFIFRDEVIISKDKIYNYFYSLDHTISIPNRVEFVKDWLMKELRKKVKVESNKSWAEEESQYLEKEDFMEAFTRLQAKNRFNENSFDDFAHEHRFLAEMVVKEKFKPLFNKVKRFKFIDIPAIYRQFLRETVNNCEGILPVDWTEICRQTLSRFTILQIPYEDAAPFVYLQDLIEGRKSSTSIRHIFIDEAQDYTPFQFAFIKLLYPYSKMTLLGDINQAIFTGDIGLSSIISGSLNTEAEVERFVLMKTYRSTKPIVEFTKGLIDDGEKIEAFNRPGKKPIVKLVRDPIELNRYVCIESQRLQKEGFRTIAIICRTEKESKQVYNELKNEISVNLIEKGTLSYENGILVIPSYLAKGIEFDAVILYNSSLYRSENERKLFYTVCTRAMHELVLFSAGEISPLMKNVSPNTYETTLCFN